MHPVLSVLDCSSRQPLSVSVLSLTRHDCLCNPSWASFWALARASMRSQSRLLMPCDNARSQPWTTTRVCCPELPQGRSTLPAPSVTWRSKPADRRTGKASGGHTDLELRPSHGAPIVQAVDCPPEGGGPLERTLQAKCHQRTCSRASMRSQCR